MKPEPTPIERLLATPLRTDQPYVSSMDPFLEAIDKDAKLLERFSARNRAKHATITALEPKQRIEDLDDDIFN